jgi:hypothetical protein
MDGLAGGLSGDAESVAVVAAGAAALVEGLEFYGPAADRIDGSVRGSSRTVGGLAQRLFELSLVLRRAALEVEAQQVARARLLERLQNEAAQAARVR